MTARVELRLCGAMDYLSITWQLGETLLQPIPFSDDADGTRYNILLAVQEMVTNVLRHAYEGCELADEVRHGLKKGPVENHTTIAPTPGLNLLLC